MGPAAASVPPVAEMTRPVLLDLGGVPETGRWPGTASAWAPRLGITPRQVLAAVFGGSDGTRPDRPDERGRLVAAGPAPAEHQPAALSRWPTDIAARWRWDKQLLACLGRVQGRARTAVVASAWPHARARLAADGVAGLAGAVVLSCQAGIAKPDRRIFGLALAPGWAPNPAVRIIDSGIHLADRLQDVHVHVIPCVRRSPSEPGIFEVATVFGSILPAVWSFQLALRARGLGTVLTTMHLPHEHQAAALLGIPGSVLQVGLIPVAYYTGRDFRPTVRRPAEQITYWNTWEATRKDD